MRDKEFFDLAREYRRQHPEIERVLQIFEDAELYLTKSDKINQLQNAKMTSSSNAGGGVYAPPTITAPFITAARSTKTVAVSERTD